MLSARRKSDGLLVSAYLERPRNGHFLCPDCGEEVLLRSGRSRIDHFAHVNPLTCELSRGESEVHRECKLEIFRALRAQDGVSNVALERGMESVRPDVFAVINGAPVAIEVQISSLSVETIMRRTIDYAQRGIYVLWLLQWTPKLGEPRYTPKPWEKWVHAAYFGRVYYWVEGLSVISYHFDTSFRTVPRRTWFAPDGEKMTSGGYSVRSKRYRRAIRRESLHLVNDFGPKQRYWWEGKGIRVPDAKLFMELENRDRSVDHEVRCE